LILLKLVLLWSIAHGGVLGEVKCICWGEGFTVAFLGTVNLIIQCNNPNNPIHPFYTHKQ